MAPPLLTSTGAELSGTKNYHLSDVLAFYLCSYLHPPLFFFF